MGNFLTIKNANFSQVAVDKVNPTPIAWLLGTWNKDAVYGALSPLYFYCSQETSEKLSGKPITTAMGHVNYGTGFGGTMTIEVGYCDWGNENNSVKLADIEIEDGIVSTFEQIIFPIGKRVYFRLFLNGNSVGMCVQQKLDVLIATHYSATKEGGLTPLNLYADIDFGLE